MKTRRQFTMPPLWQAVTAMAVALTAPAILTAQETGTVEGTVIDAGTDAPLSGAQIQITETQQGTLTDQEGRFSLADVPAGEVTVRVQMIGFAAGQRSVTVAAGEAAEVAFALEQTAIGLDRVVVTGTAGGAARRAVGHSVGQLDVGDLTERAPVGTVTDMLQARAPGLTVMRGSGASGTAASFRLRGAGSLSGGNQPIFIIDGVRMRAGGQAGWGVSGQSRSELDALSPEDIESIEILKGPSATTLYGAEAASGVINITTKRGDRGEPNVQWRLRAETGRQDWNLPHPTNFTTCTESRVENPDAWPGCDGQGVGAVLEDNPLQRDENALRTGNLQDYALSARGGGENYSFYVSGTHADEQGVYRNNNYRRTGARANFAIEASDRMDVSFNAGYSFGGAREQISFGAFGNNQRHIEGFPLAGYWPTDVVRDDQGNPVVDEEGNVEIAEDRVFVGPSTPTLEVGLTNTVSLFGDALRLYGFLDYQGGHYMWNASEFVRTNNDGNSWNANNADGDPVQQAVLNSGAHRPFVEPADFIKIRELSATVGLPSTWLPAVGLDDLSLTLAGRNLGIWTRYGGPDPEVNFHGNSAFSRSDYMSTPMMRQFTASLNVSF